MKNMQIGLLLIGFFLLSGVALGLPACTGVNGAPGCLSYVELECPNYFDNQSGVYYQCTWNETNSCIPSDSACDWDAWYASSTSSSSYASSTLYETTSSSSSSSSSYYTSSSSSHKSTTSSSSSSRASSSSSSSLNSIPPTTTLWGESTNSTIDFIISLLPKFGDLLNGVGTNLIWPVVYILIILGIAAVILGLFGMITSVVLAVVGAVSRFSGGLGKRH